MKHYLLMAMWLILSIGALPSLSSAIVVSDDPAYHEFGYVSEFNGVGYLSLSGGSSGVLISPNLVLTAAHVVGGNITGHTFKLYTDFGQESFNLVEKFVHEYVDLAVVRLDRTTGLAGYKLNTRLNEVGSDVIVAGFGYSGIGYTQASQYPKGVGRYGSNVIDRTIIGLLIFDFDKQKNDVMVTTGDSGGPTFMRINGELELVGIHVGVTDMDGDGILAEYGDQGYDVRLGAYADWINSVIFDTSFLEGDANHDGVVSIGDYAAVQANFGNIGYGILGDANLDGIVSAGDYASIQSNFGNTDNIFVEPSTIIFIISGIVLFGRNKKF